jgi:putative ABC transport system permease protein
VTRAAVSGSQETSRGKAGFVRASISTGASWTTWCPTTRVAAAWALGAGRPRVFFDVVCDGMTTVLLGTVLGSAGAWFVGRLMRGMVYGVGVVDPITFLLATLTLLAAALVASLMPARRAASVDPMIALRQK